MSEKIKSLNEMKAALRANMGTPQTNANAAKALAGARFWAENGKGEKVIGVILEELSPKGKVQARLGCIAKDCNETHIREQSDWHQSVRCRVHSSLSRVALTEQQVTERRLEKAKARVELLESKANRRSREVNEARPSVH